LQELKEKAAVVLEEMVVRDVLLEMPSLLLLRLRLRLLQSQGL
jgi:hypothetical protein